MNVANPQEGADVRLVGLGGQRVAEKNDRLDVALCHSTADNQIAAVRSVGDRFDVQPQPLAQQGARIAGGDEIVLAEKSTCRSTNSSSEVFFSSWAMRAIMLGRGLAINGWRDQRSRLYDSTSTISSRVLSTNPSTSLFSASGTSNLLSVSVRWPMRRCQSLLLILMPRCDIRMSRPV